MGLTRVVLAAEWSLFIAIWVACSFVFRTSGQKKRLKARLLYPCSAFFLITVIVYFSKDFISEKFVLQGFFGYAVEKFGIVLAVGGFFFAIWARIILASNWSGAPAVIEGQVVIKEGPYALVRHPIYTGVIAMLWGSFLTEGFFFLCIVAFMGTVLLYWKAKIEEALLLKYFSDEYSGFMKTIPMLLPFFSTSGKVYISKK